MASSTEPACCSSAAKLSLVEALLAEPKARPCALLALRWLERHAGVRLAVCALADHGSRRLSGWAGLGVAPAEVDSFSVDLADLAHPLTRVLASGEPVACHGPDSLGRTFETPLGNGPFLAVPLGSAGERAGVALGLLLLAGPTGGPVSEDVLWNANLLAVRLASIWYHGTDQASRRIPRLHDLSEAEEKARLYEQVKRHSEELRERVREATAELAEQNELLRRQAFQLEQASALKSQFLANVSHELRTPLNAIMGYTHLLLEGVSGDLTRPQQDKLNRVDANARHLLAVINDLLDLSRIESGKMPVQIEQVLLPELIDEVMTEVEPVIAGTRLEVHRELAPELPEITTDRQKVKQIVLNLLSNALKFTPEGTVAIRLQHDGDSGEILIAVSDTGIGIAEENQKTIFEAFQQANSSYVRRQGGTGLGLTICRRLAHLLDGRITLLSRLGEGSTFTLFLPCKRMA